jgi:hypothetical protein
LSRRGELVSYKFAKISKGGRNEKMLRMLTSNRAFKNIKDYCKRNLYDNQNVLGSIVVEMRCHLTKSQIVGVTLFE